MANPQIEAERTVLLLSDLREESEITGALYGLKKDLEQSNEDYRNIKLREWSKSDHFWRGFQRLFWDETSSSWLHPGILKADDLLSFGLDDDEENINIFRAHGESIIAALSTGAPHIRFYPMNAEEPDDLTTASTYDKLSEMIANSNKFELLYIKALFLWYQQDYIAAHIENQIDEEKMDGSMRTNIEIYGASDNNCLLYTSPSPRDS